MQVRFARPDTGNLVFHVYGRSVHPELFQTYAETQLVLPQISAGIRICKAGHVIEVRQGNETLTEIAAEANQLFPVRKRLLERRLRGSRDDGFRLESGLKYQVSFQLEQVEPDIYQNLHEEFLYDSRRADLACRFPPSSRLSPEPLSLIRTEMTTNSLLVHAFHTFPENCSIVKSQTLIELS